jgi:hypothetical protein
MRTGKLKSVVDATSRSKGHAGETSAEPLRPSVTLPWINQLQLVFMHNKGSST